jgi:hypothetical protein
VAGEVTDDTVAKSFGIALDHAADDVDLATGDGRLDAPHHGLVGALDQQPGLLVHVPAEVRRVGVSVDATDERGDVDVDDVAILERAVVGDAVTDDFVDAGAYRLREVAITQRRGIGAVVKHELVGDPIELIGGDAGCDRLGGALHRLRRDASGDPHLLDGLSVLDLRTGVPRGSRPIDILWPGDGGGDGTTSADGAWRDACIGDRHTVESRQDG